MIPKSLTNHSLSLSELSEMISVNLKLPKKSLVMFLSIRITQVILSTISQITTRFRNGFSPWMYNRMNSKTVVPCQNCRYHKRQIHKKRSSNLAIVRRKGELKVVLPFNGKWSTIIGTSRTGSSIYMSFWSNVLSNLIKILRSKWRSRTRVGWLKESLRIKLWSLKSTFMKVLGKIWKIKSIKKDRYKLICQSISTKASTSKHSKWIHMTSTSQLPS